MYFVVDDSIRLLGGGGGGNRDFSLGTRRMVEYLLMYA